MSTYTVPRDASIEDTVADVTGGDPADIDWLGDGAFASDAPDAPYVFTGHLYGDTIRVSVDNEGDATFTII